jgi:aspartate aminotransferase
MNDIMEYLSKRVTSMEESATIKMAQMARNLKAEGKDVISLSLGEPDFDTPDHIKEAAKKALDAGHTKYTPVPGVPELRKAISEKFRRDNQLDYSPEQIVVSNGAKQSIANISLALLDEGDEAIIFAPYWVSYYPIIKLSGATPVVLSAGVEQDYKVTASQLEHAINEKTRLVIFSSPCNPTGSVYHKEELAALVAVLEKNKHVFIVSDEIYEYINFTDTHISIGSFEAVKDRTITVNGFSKGFAMTGWRLGYMGAPLAIAKACTKLQGQFTSGANSFSQLAGAYALESDLGPSMKMKEAFLERRDMVLNLLRDIPGVKTNIPEGAFYIFPDMSAYFGKKSQDGQLIKDSDVLSEYLLRDALVALVSGSAFGAPECIRISYAASEEELREAVKRIKTSLEKLS